MYGLRTPTQDGWTSGLESALGASFDGEGKGGKVKVGSNVVHSRRQLFVHITMGIGVVHVVGDEKGTWHLGSEILLHSSEKALFFYIAAHRVICCCVIRATSWPHRVLT